MLCAAKRAIPAFLVAFGFILGCVVNTANAQVSNHIQDAGIEVVRVESQRQKAPPIRQGSLRQLQRTVEYTYDVEILFTFDDDFEDLPDERLEEVQDVTRLTEIFFRRLVGTQFSTAFQQVICQYLGGESDIRVGTDDEGRLTLGFDALLTTIYRITSGTPNSEAALMAVQTFDRDGYLENYVSLARPGSFAP